MLGASVLVVFGCSTPVRPAAPPDEENGPGADFRPDFEQYVYPVLARDCAFPDCHGTPDRFFRVYAPGRVRLPAEDGTDTAIKAAPTPIELDEAYDRARSMLAGVSTPAQSRLVRKPLASSAGGGAHKGVDGFERNVYRNKRTVGWCAIAKWAGVSVELRSSCQDFDDSGMYPPAIEEWARVETAE